MFKIIVEKECSCFKKSDLVNGLEMESKDGALLKSIEMRDTMNDEFCGKHSFKVQEVGDSFVIAMSDSTSNGCCGGGCGSH
ncbi:hypothetical protein [Sulfurimonas sp.]|jgi:hypothetical protein|uniref:hypothetical protein n=1 Tax=Sulfurimonas sp. TaxID=2022749 RepID=UPI002A35DAC9|nr:hypothetical protein [Sulfurimonas sp.]MDY0124252.1 hypothetical protein [Sulfurimonas sp.]